MGTCNTDKAPLDPLNNHCETYEAICNGNPSTVRRQHMERATIVRHKKMHTIHTLLPQNQTNCTQDLYRPLPQIKEHEENFVHPNTDLTHIGKTTIMFETN